MVEDPRLEKIREAVMRRPDLPRSHFRDAFEIGAKKLDEWCDAGLLNIPRRSKGQSRPIYLFTRKKT